jgi:hypothetical protein
MTLGKYGMSGLAAVVVLSLTGCDNGPSAVRTRDRDVASAGYDAPAAVREDGGGYSADRSPYRSNRTPSGGGDTWWAATKKYPAAESADYHFKRDGGDFGATDVKDYVAKAHAFISHPPHGTQTLKRKNGDTLYYDPRGNVFAVATRDGAPRTMFKPRDGAAYWDQQKTREADGGDRNYRSRSNDDQG